MLGSSISGSKDVLFTDNKDYERPGLVAPPLTRLGACRGQEQIGGLRIKRHGSCARLGRYRLGHHKMARALFPYNRQGAVTVGAKGKTVVRVENAGVGALADNGGDPFCTVVQTSERLPAASGRIWLWRGLESPIAAI